MKLLKIEMHLSAFGVESDSFPSIDAYIDFVNDSSTCKKSYYNPDIKGFTYKLSNSEIKKISQLLQTVNLCKLKKDYTEIKSKISDLPSSKISIFTDQQKFIIDDYGLQGDYPLKELYKIVYKLNY